MFKFLISSVSGIILFFLPVIEGQVPIVFLAGVLKELLWEYKVILIISIILWEIISRINWCFKKKIKKVSVAYAAFSLLCVWYLEVGNIFTEQITKEIIELIYTVIITTLVSGIGVSLLLYSGIIEFMSVFAKPIMTPLFKLPGSATVDCLASFVSSPSVGVLFTSVCYEEGKYTEKEACSIVTNFSVVSIGFMSALCSMVGIEEYLYKVILTSFVLVILLAWITIRVPPLSRKEGRRESSTNINWSIDKTNNLIYEAVQEGVSSAKKMTYSNFKNHVIRTWGFIRNMVILMIAPVIIMNYVIYYSDIMEWLGRPFEVILSKFSVPDAKIIAPTLLMGLIEVALPAMYVATFEVTEASAFFVVVLSIVQVIFFSETGVIILSSKIPLNIKELIIIYLERTFIAIPILAIIVQYMF